MTVHIPSFSSLDFRQPQAGFPSEIRKALQHTGAFYIEGLVSSASQRALLGDGFPHLTESANWKAWATPQQLRQRNLSPSGFRFSKLNNLRGVCWQKISMGRPHSKNWDALKAKTADPALVRSGQNYLLDTLNLAEEISFFSQGLQDVLMMAGVLTASHIHQMGHRISAIHFSPLDPAPAKETVILPAHFDTAIGTLALAASEPGLEILAENQWTSAFKPGYALFFLGRDFPSVGPFRAMPHRVVASSSPRSRTSLTYNLEYTKKTSK